ncbi:type III secretion system gatekeeper subunit SctW [Rouxiella sp. T17]|uniref:type III secretion system gatekeeper subunit SctW n=1 Tax=Rouxiella sp. T17 TaxID=3085684 RepID=UPI002FCA3893
MSTINNDYGRSSMMIVREQQRGKAQEKKESSNAKASEDSLVDDQQYLVLDNESSADLLAKASQSVDEWMQGFSLFRSRKDLMSKSGADAENNFDSILEDNSIQKIAMLLKMVSNVKGNSIKDMLFTFFKQFPDESDRVIILRKALQRSDIDESVKVTLRSVLKKLEESGNTKLLKAGINVALKARLFGQSLGISASLLRSTYRNFLESDGDDIETYKSWISIFGYKQRHKILEFIEEALLIDISSTAPSCMDLEFGQLLSHLLKLKQIRSLESEFIQGLLTQKNITRINSSEEKWLLFVFCIQQDPHGVEVYLKDIDNLPETHDNTSKKARFYQSLLALIKGLPDYFFNELTDKSAVEILLKLKIGKYFKRETLGRNA